MFKLSFALLSSMSIAQWIKLTRDLKVAIAAGQVVVGDAHPAIVAVEKVLKEQQAAGVPEEAAVVAAATAGYTEINDPHYSPGYEAMTNASNA